MMTDWEERREKETEQYMYEERERDYIHCHIQNNKCIILLWVKWKFTTLQYYETFMFALKREIGF